MFLSRFFCCAVFGFFGGIITTLCLTTLWRIEEAGKENEEYINFLQNHEERCCLAAVFGAIGGMMAVLCLNALWRVEQADDGGIEDQYEESQKQAQEHDERLP